MYKLNLILILKKSKFYEDPYFNLKSITNPNVLTKNVFSLYFTDVK